MLHLAVKSCWGYFSTQFLGHAMTLPTESKDDILTIRIPDERLVEPTHLARLFEDLEAILSKSTEDRLILDFSKVQFMASSALGKVVQFHKKAIGYKAKLKLCGIVPEIYEVFKITKLHKVLDIEKDEAAARKAHQKKGLFR